MDERAGTATHVPGEVQATREVPVRIGDLRWTTVVPADLPLKRVELELAVTTDAELRQIVRLVGGIKQFSSPETADRLLSLYNRNDIEGELKATLYVWLEGDEFIRQLPPLPRAIRELLDEAEGVADA